MTNEFKLICKSEIEEAHQNHELLGRNPDAGRIFHFIAVSGGFQGQTTRKGIVQQLYVFEEPEPQVNRPARVEDRGESYGSGRWERLGRGKASFYIREAQFVHDGLVAAMGQEWGKAFKPEELVLLSFHDFLQKAVTLGLPWSDGRIPPAIAMEIIWLAQEDRSLTIQPVDPFAGRLGGVANSENRNLQSTCSLPHHEPGEKYVLHLRGVKVGIETAFVLESAVEDLMFENVNQHYCGFPIRLFNPDTKNSTIKPAEEASFEFYDIKGSFAFIAVTFPKSWNFEDMFGVEANIERWTCGQYEKFIRALRQIQHKQPDTVRIGWYGYKVD